MRSRPVNLFWLTASGHSAESHLRPGYFAAHTLLKTEVPITVLRGRFHTYQGIHLMPTYHPAYLLKKSRSKKAGSGKNMQMIMKTL